MFIFLFAFKLLVRRDFGGDFVVYFLPHYNFIFSSIKSGDIPLWFPYSYNGLPEIFKSELAMFHPITLLALVANLLINKSEVMSYTGNIFEILWFVYLAFGSIGMFKLCSEVFKINQLCSLAAALIFSLNPLMLASMNTTVFLGISILPWIIYYLVLMLEHPSYKHILYFIICNYLLFAAGYPYFYVYFLLCQLGLVIAYGKNKFILFISTYTIAFLLAAFFLFPNTYIYLQSARNTSQSGSSFELFTSNIPSRIVNILNPMPFGESYSRQDPASVFTSNGVSWGTFALIYLAIGISQLKKDKFSIWLTCTFFIAFFYSFGGYMSSSQFFGNFIPLIDKFRSHSIGLVLSMFAGCIFIAQGLELTLNGIRNKNIEIGFWIIMLLSYIGLSAIPIIVPDYATSHLQQVLSLSRTAFLLLASLILLHLTAVNKTKAFIGLSLLFILLECHFYFTNLNGHFLDTTYNKYYAANSLLPINKNVDELYRVYFDNNQFAYNTAKHKVFLYAGYETVPYRGWYDFQNKYGFNTSLALSNVKYMVTTNPAWHAQNPTAKLIRDTGPLEKPQETFVSTVEGLPYLSARSQNSHYIYELSNYLPRYFAPINSDVNNLHVDIQQEPNPNVQIDILEYKSDMIRMRVTSPDKTIVVGSETYDKGWQLTIDGKDSKVYKFASYFRGFIVPQGTSEILMTYRMPMLNYGILVSIGGVITLAAIYFNFDKLRKYIS